MRAAREVFSEHGYEAATFQAIAVRADLTRPAINHYFSSKGMLYREVVEQTNNLVVAAGIERARGETTLIGRLSSFITAATQADAENPWAAAFLITTVLESRRHPDLSRFENDALRGTREFLNWALGDAIQRGELDTSTDISSLTEMLVMVLCGVGFYAGFVGNRQQVDTTTERLRDMLAGTLWQLKGTTGPAGSDVAHSSI